MTQRQERVKQRIKEEISSILHDKIKDPRIGFITVTRIELTADLQYAKIFYSVLGNEDNKKQAQLGLKSAYKYIRRLLGENLELRYTPEITFKFDTSIEYNIRIGKIFDKIEKERRSKKGNDEDEQTAGS